MKRFRKFLAEAPTTNLKTVTAVWAAMFAMVVWATTIFIGKEVNQVGLGLILSFILTWMFDGRRQFEIKRNTTWRDGDEGASGKLVDTKLKDEETRNICPRCNRPLDGGVDKD